MGHTSRIHTGGNNVIEILALAGAVTFLLVAAHLATATEEAE